MKFCAVFLVLLATTYGLPINQCENEFREFKEKYNKLYSTYDEENLRMNIFCKNLQTMQQHNKDFESGKATYKMGINDFSDLTGEEMQQFHGFMPHNRFLSLSDCDTEWASFREIFNKLYNSEEETYRYNIFCNNLQVIKKHNNYYDQGLVSFKMDVNQFSDLTEAEMKQFMGVLPRKMFSGAGNCQKELANFKDDFHKLYNPKEETQRYQIFCRNLELMQQHNEKYEQGLVTYESGVNQFSDYTEEEMKQFMGYQPHNITASESCQNSWTAFKSTYNKLYDSEEEEIKRFQIFCKNSLEIEKHNKDYEQGLTTYRMNMNQFSDMTDEEMKDHMGFVPHHMLVEDNECQKEWQNFKVEYNKLYRTEREESKRREIFCKNLDLIEKHNRLYEQGLFTDKYGVNQFTDLSAEEMSKYHGFNKGAIA